MHSFFLLCRRGLEVLESFGSFTPRWLGTSRQVVLGLSASLCFVHIHLAHRQPVTQTTATTTTTTCNAEFKSPLSLRVTILVFASGQPRRPNASAVRRGAESASSPHSFGMSGCLCAWALAEALHHSSGPSTKKVVERREEQEEVEYEMHIAPRGQNTPPRGTRPGLVSETGPHVKLQTGGSSLGSRWPADLCLACTGGVGR